MEEDANVNANVRQLIDQWERFAKPSLNLESSELPRLYQHAEATKAFLREDAEEFVKGHRKDPMMCSYESDSTHSRTLKIFTEKIGDAKVRRSGGEQ